MDENENIYDKIREFFGNGAGNLNILEEQIDVDVQLKYFDRSRKYKKNPDPGDAIALADNLFKEEINIERKKEILIKLASMEEVKAFRILQSYMEERPDELRDWTILALQESKMLLESKLLDENQIFISTGLGGKGDKLRYFVVIIANRENEFNDFQKKIIRQEFLYTLEKHESEVENFDFSENLATIMAIVPLDKPVKAVFEEAIEECNNYGDFIKNDFVITNVKKLSFQEINDFLEEKSRDRD